MNPEERRRINRSRLKQWERLLNSKNSTPLIVVGIGHGRNLGEAHIITVEDMTDLDIYAYLRRAAELVAERMGAK